MCAHCKEFGIARVIPTREATAESSQPCWALGEEQSGPEEHKILTAACLCPEFAYKEVNRGPLQGGSCLSAVKGIAVRGSTRSLSTAGRFPQLQPRSYPGEAELGPAFSTSGMGKAQPGLSPRNHRVWPGQRPGHQPPGAQTGHRGETQAAESSLLLLEVNTS